MNETLGKLFMEDDMCIQHLYQGKIISVWIAWYKARPESYVVGKSAHHARELLFSKPRIDFYNLLQSSGGGVLATSPTFPGLEGIGATNPEAEEDLVYKINLQKGIPTWRRIAMKLHKNEFLEPLELLALEGKL